MANRIKGQDVTITLANNGVVIGDLIRDVRNFELTPKFEKLEEQYLGQLTKMYDNIFHGVDFKMDLHLETARALNFIKFVKDSAQSRGPGTASAINITASLIFPGGTTRNVQLNSCYLEDMPLTIGGRSEFVQFSISGSCSDIMGLE